MKLSVLASALLFVASGAMAAPPAEQAAPAEQTSAATNAAEGTNPDAEKKVCRTERATGSLTRRTRVCMTAAQWREVNDRTKKGVDEMNSAAAGGKVCIPDPADPFHGCPG